MPSLTFEAFLHLFQTGWTSQEIIAHGLSDFLRAGDDMYLHEVADHLDRASDTSDQKQAEAEIRAALQALEQAADLYRMGTPEPLAQMRTEISADSVSTYYKQRGYYLASLSFTVISMLSKHLGFKEQCERAADRALGMFQRYRSTVMQAAFYPPSVAGTSTTGKHKPSTTMKLNKEQAALHKVLKKWLDTRTVKALILLYNRW